MRLVSFARLAYWFRLFVHIKEAAKMAQIYSDLHQNIQDKFNEAGIEIMSPHYMAVRDGNETTIPKDDLRNSDSANQTGQGDKTDKV